MATEREKGRCLCGQVHFEIDRSAVMSVHHCHCLDCQRVTGSGFVTLAIVPMSNFSLTGDSPSSYGTPGTSGSTITRSFCGNCGSQVYSQTSDTDELIFIKAGSLDNSDWLSLTSSFWGSTARPWAPADHSCMVHDANPVI